MRSSTHFWKGAAAICRPEKFGLQGMLEVNMAIFKELMAAATCKEQKKKGRSFRVLRQPARREVGSMAGAFSTFWRTDQVVDTKLTPNGFFGQGVTYLIRALDNDEKVLAALGLSKCLTFEGIEQEAARIFETIYRDLLSF